MKITETIYALATAPGRAGVAVIRLSGPAAREVAEALCGPLPEVRYMYLRKIRESGDREAWIDQGLVVQFAHGQSYTGEAMVEFHLHGGRATITRFMEVLGQFDGVRPAEAGEFTRQALINGKMDLSQVTGLADLIDAETELQRRQALAIARGSASRTVNQWRENLLNVLSLLEAVIEFSDESDTPDEVLPRVRDILLKIHSEINATVQDSIKARKLRQGYMVALVGPPNAGKSTLINCLANEECAIVSPVAGTTRDVLRVTLDLDGLAVTFIDMAGLRETQDQVERIGIEKAIEIASQADIRVFLRSPDTGAPVVSVEKHAGDITVWAKSDLGLGEADFLISVKTGEGIQKLTTAITERLKDTPVGSAVVTHQRQISLLRSSLADLEKAIKTQVEEICSEHIRYAIRGLHGIVDPISDEAVLDEVFSRFCIGK